MKIAIIIVNYRMADLLIRCLDSLTKVLNNDVNVFISDNNSLDDSVIRINQFIKERDLQNQIKIIELPVNGGFSYGNNKAIEFALSICSDIEVFWLLNPDTFLTTFNINYIKKSFENKKVGIIGTRIISSVTGEPESSSFNFPTPFSQFLLGAKCGPLFRMFPKHTISFAPPESITTCDWVSGASLLIRREVFDSISGMDENFFLYFEEIDLCLRVREMGWEILHDPNVVVVHEDKSSTGIDTTESRRPSFWYNSRRRYYIKHFGISGLLLADLGWFLGRLSLLFRHYIGLRADLSKDPKHFMSDLIFGDIRAVLNYYL